ncbi:MAG: PKD domain-containing protein [Chitinophagales bacterium]|nr:PKD domain-containing protein [Chitinophagales bacterium]
MKHWTIKLNLLNLSCKAFGLGTIWLAFSLIPVLHSCHLEKLDNIKDGLIASFNYQFIGDSNFAPTTVEFQNTSTEATFYEWDFGDEGHVSNEANPIYTFQRAGEFRVLLTAGNSEGVVDEYSEIITIRSSSFELELEAETSWCARAGGIVQLDSNSYKILTTINNRWSMLNLTLDGRITDTTNSASLNLPDQSLDCGCLIAYNNDSNSPVSLKPAFVSQCDDDIIIGEPSFYFDPHLVLRYEDFGIAIEPILHNNTYSVVGNIIGPFGQATNKYNVIHGTQELQSVTYDTLEFLTAIDAVIAHNYNLSVLVKGLSSEFELNQNLRIDNFSPNGELIGTINLGQVSHAYNGAFVFLESGNYLLVGKSLPTDSICLQWINELGTILKEKKISAFFDPNDIIPTLDGGYLISGIYHDLQIFKGVILKVDAEGNKIWQEEIIDEEDSVIPTKIIQTMDGGFLAYCIRDIFRNDIVIYKLTDKGEFNP